MKKGTIGFLAAITGAVAGGIGTGIIKNKTINEKVGKVDKFKGYYNILNQWLVLKNEGKSLTTYFNNNNYKKIAIYGMGELGSRLYEELKNTDIEVKYAIDKNVENTYSELEVVGLEDNWDDVDAIVVTAIFAFNEIEEELSNKVQYEIISLEDVIYEI